MDNFEKAIVSNRAGINIVDFLADETPLSKSRIKQVIQIGGVWMMRADEDPIRVHRAKQDVKLNDEIHIYYDESLLSIEPEPLLLIEDHDFYSIWEKPAGIWAEQSLYSDHLSLERAIARSVPVDRDCYWAYPSAAEIGGLFIVVHTRAVAAKFEQLSEQGGIAIDIVCIHPGIDDIELVDGSKLEGVINDGQTVFSDVQGFELDIVESILEYDLTMPINHGILCTKIAFDCPVSGEKRQFQLKKSSN